MEEFTELLERIGRIPYQLTQINEVLSQLGYKIQVIKQDNVTDTKNSGLLSEIPVNIEPPPSSKSPDDPPLLIKSKVNSSGYNTYKVTSQFEYFVRQLRASDALRQFINDNWLKPFAPRVIFEAIKALELKGAIPESTFYNALGRLCQKGILKRVKSGVYQAKG